MPVMGRCLRVWVLAVPAAASRDSPDHRPHCPVDAAGRTLGVETPGLLLSQLCLQKPATRRQVLSSTGVGGVCAAPESLTRKLTPCTAQRGASTQLDDFLPPSGPLRMLHLKYRHSGFQLSGSLSRPPVHTAGPRP